MDIHLITLLRRTPGIICNPQGPKRQTLPIDEWTRILAMKNPESRVQLDKWIRVEKGTYKGDVGFVVGVESGEVEVLLVPRQAPNSKRKCTFVRPQPELFDPEVFRLHLHNDDPEQQRDGFYTYNGLRFEHGLLRKSYSFHSLVSTSEIPNHLMIFFQLSDHPRIVASTFPRPREWIFEEDEQVLVRSSGRNGIVSAVQPDLLEVDLGVEGLRAIKWADVRKAIKVGDFVNVASGRLQGKSGWVVEVDEDIVSIVEKKPNPITTADPSITIEVKKKFQFKYHKYLLTLFTEI